MVLTDELSSIGVQAEKIGRILDHGDLFLCEVRETVADHLFHDSRVVALVNWILDRVVSLPKRRR